MLCHAKQLKKTNNGGGGGGGGRKKSEENGAKHLHIRAKERGNTKGVAFPDCFKRGVGTAR